MALITAGVHACMSQIVLPENPVTDVHCSNKCFKLTHSCWGHYLEEKSRENITHPYVGVQLIVEWERQASIPTASVIEIWKFAACHQSEESNIYEHTYPVCRRWSWEMTDEYSAISSGWRWHIHWKQYSDVANLAYRKVSTTWQWHLWYLIRTQT